MMFTNCVLCDAGMESCSYNLVDGPYSKIYIKMLCTVLAGIKISYILIKCLKCNISDGLISVTLHQGFDYPYVSFIQEGIMIRHGSYYPTCHI
jgi:hypothetical protein